MVRIALAYSFSAAQKLPSDCSKWLTIHQNLRSVIVTNSIIDLIFALSMGRLEQLRILLVQIRQDAHLLPAEREEFVELSQLREDQITTLDVFQQPDFAPNLVNQYDALMIGGLSDDDSEQIALPDIFDPFIKPLMALMQRAIDCKIPSLLSCGGFMLASELVGARVVIDRAQAELGMYDIWLTPTALHDPLFRGFPASFRAVSGHIKSTIDLPNSCHRLAYSEKCQIHGFKVADAPFYAFQFHPEISCEDLVARVGPYREKYFPSKEAYLEFIKMSGSTDIANSMVHRFVQLVADE